MKNNKNLLLLAAAMVVGAAGAQTTGTAPTVAGTEIRNVATASFTDPANPSSTTPKTVESNPVTTTVKAVPEFDIQFNGNTPADGEGDAAAKVNNASTTTEKIDRRVDQPLITEYDLINTGNVALTVDLAANVGDSTGITAANVAYYATNPDTDGDGILSAAELSAATPIPSLLVAANDGTKDSGPDEISFFQVISIPAGATKDQVIGASPEGSVTGTAANGITGTLYEDQIVAADGTPIVDNAQDSPAKGTDLQFVAVNLTTIDTTPPTGPEDPTKPGVPTPPTTTITPPPTDNPGTPGGGTPTDPVDPNDPNPDPNDPETPGYTDPGTPGDPTDPPVNIAVDVAGDRQIAFPPADDDNGPASDGVGGTNTPDNVTFNNVVSTPSTTSPTPVSLYPVDANGNAVSPTSPGVYEMSNGTTVTLLNNDGNPFTTFDTNGNPVVIVPADGTANYKVKVEYPDPSDTDTPGLVTTVIAADLDQDTANKPDATTTDIIVPSAMQFGDTTTGQGADPDGVQDLPADAVAPSLEDYDKDPNTPQQSIVRFPMDVANNAPVVPLSPLAGATDQQYNETYNLSGYVIVQTETGEVFVSVIYEAGDTDHKVVKTGTTTPVTVQIDTDGDGIDETVTYNVPVYITDVVEPGTEADVVAVVEMPANALPTRDAAGNEINGGDPMLQQTAKANYSGITLEDNNNPIKIVLDGEFVIGKFVKNTGTVANTEYVSGQPGAAQAGTPPADTTAVTNPADYSALNDPEVAPKGQLEYRIIAKNDYNTAIKNFFVCDKVPANTKFISVSGGDLYRVDGGAWSASVDSALVKAGTATDKGSEVCVAVNDGNGAPASLASGATFTVDFVVEVK